MKYDSESEIEDACYKYLESHLCEGEKWGLKFRYYRPSLTKYGPHQWLWDSGWHMITWSYRNPDNSIQDLHTMLQFQQPNGFIPEIIKWEKVPFYEKFANHFFGYSNEKYTDLTQMPMLPFSLRAIWNATQSEEFLKEYVPKIIHYFEWWANERDPDGDHLVSIIHPWESGIDASPLYDPAHGVNNPKYGELYPNFLRIQRQYKTKAKWNLQKILQMQLFDFEDVGVCSVYAEGWGELGRLAQVFDEEMAQKCFVQQKLFEDAIISKCWDEDVGHFVSYYHNGGQEHKSTIEAHQELFPLLLDSIPKELQTKCVDTLLDPEKYWLAYPVPSVPKSEPTFNPNRNRLLWRGTNWPSTTWLITEGLIKHNYLKEANEILDRLIELYENHGVWEYYNPITGEGLGEEGIGMSTMIVDLLHRLNRV